MDTNKILSANLLDILFDNRNKAYGAYDLRKTYSKRVAKSLIFTGVFVSLVFTGVALGNKMTPKEEPTFLITKLYVSTLTPEEPEPEPIPEPIRKKEQPPVQTVPYTPIVIEPNEEAVTLPPSIEDLEHAIFGLEKIEGDKYDGTVQPPVLTDPKGIIADKIEVEPEGPVGNVEIAAKFDGNWKRFLEKNLNPQVAIDNHAPAGQYTVLMQFVVDVDGTVSNIKALNNPGYGLEQEAIRVIKKSKKWEPAIQNGRTVKAYRKQPITFLVSEDF
jgi:protein TonB